MYYDVAVTVPCQTPASLPVVVSCPVSAGTVARVAVAFPPGCAGLVHVRVFRSAHQVWPSNLDGSFAADDERIEFQEDYPVGDSPFEFVVKAWNDDDTFAHCVNVRFNILPEIQVSGLPKWLLRLLKRV